jgi:hypothetical protein
MHFCVHFYLTFDCYAAAAAVCSLARPLNEREIDFSLLEFFMIFVVVEMSLFTSFNFRVGRTCGEESGVECENVQSESERASLLGANVCIAANICN